MARRRFVDGLIADLGEHLRGLWGDTSRWNAQRFVLRLTVLSAAGAVKNYYGFALFRLLIMLVGGLIGVAIGIAAAERYDVPSGADILLALVAGCVAAMLAWFFQLAAVFLVGACLGGAAVFLASHHPVGALVGAAVGGIVAVALYRPFIVVLTVGAGSLTLTFCALNLWVAASGGLEAVWDSHYRSWLRYARRMYDLASQQGLEGLAEHAAADLAVFCLFAATGLFWQFRTAGKRRKAGVRSPDPPRR